MSSSLGKSAFVSGLLALPVPVLIPVIVQAIEGAESSVNVLASESAVSFYAVTWALCFIVAFVSTQLAGQKSASGRSSKSSSSKGNVGSGTEGAELGSVKWFNVNKGFGFITTEAGDDIFVHFRSIQGRGRRSLRQGQQVRFDISDGDKGLQADNVSVVGK